ncbi:transcription intermediary factor 1-beta-like [Mizuhopecten yessoensis]|uniref:transcription intermediary factor 1-beta-like n=1 Tax=Mizuhopecten yessoensis TaxID=6573 RepID=UPI000B459649|nr:transcription intermediary factor 1-beta-like [Mizuhopecten yessoensis]
MAEGGLPPELDLHLQKCSICLEKLQQPKSLPCLHSFYQDCLGTYITKELTGKMASATSFPCPVCRRMTSPVHQRETKDKWAEQFPTNNVIQDLIQLRERSSEPLCCKPCQTKGNLNIPAKFWCNSMNDNFCETCKVELHDVIHTDCGIVDFTMNKNNRFQPKKSAPRCDRHGKKIVWYCEDHQLLCCNICFFKDHRRCEEVSTVKEYFLKLKAGTKLNEMRAVLKKGGDVMDTLVKDFEEQLKTMTQNQETALQSISDLRKKVDKRLNKLQKDITDKLTMLFKEEKGKKEASLRQCERLMYGMLNTLRSSNKAVEENDHIDTIVLYQRGKAEVESCMTLITEFSKSFTSVSIEHQIVSGHDIISDNGMGKIVVAKESRCIPCQRCDITPPLSERRVKEIGRFNIKSPSD